jgi:phage anti-repressor protein
MRITKNAIEIYTTQKGNPAILASELRTRLGIKTRLSVWLPRMIEYGFEEQKDYYQVYKNVPLVQGGSKQQFDWILTLDMAKEICMIQRNPAGKAIRNYLLTLDKKVHSGELLTPEQTAVLLDLIQVMGFASVRKTCERLHARRWDQPSTWWQHRAKLLGYSVSDLKNACQSVGIRYKSQQQAQIQLDRYELIRVAVIDLFVALGKSDAYAQNMGHAAKVFAQKVPPVFDNDRPGEIDFKTPEQRHLIEGLIGPTVRLLL